MIPCTGADRSDARLFAGRCGHPSTWVTPRGPRCEACAEGEMAVISEGACLLVIIAESQGRTREDILAGYRRMQ